MKKIAVYPGSFDPITNGHVELIKKGMDIFDEIVVAIAKNVQKKPMFSISERMRMTKGALEDCKGVSVESFDSLLVDYVKKRGGVCIIRGMRAVSDFEHEMQMALMNRKLENTLQTVFLVPSLRYIFLSSTIIKEVASYGGSVEGLVPENVEKALVKKFMKRAKS
jgi:pantetheine-phosphate adenylyltransferase